MFPGKEVLIKMPNFKLLKIIEHALEMIRKCYNLCMSPLGDS